MNWISNRSGRSVRSLPEGPPTRRFIDGGAPRMGG